MSVAAAQSDDPAELAPVMGDLTPVRVRGGVSATFAAREAATRVLGFVERDGYRLRFPFSEHGCEAVIINTGGGIVGGDVVHHIIHAERAADVLVTSQSAERIYRALPGSTAEIACTMTVADGARLAWIPQETILYSGACLSRWLSASIAADARVLVAEMVVLGRRAHGERMTSGALTDRWHIMRDKRPVFAETLRLDGDIDATLARRAVADGCHVTGLAVLIAPDAEEQLAAVRRTLVDAPCRVAASAFDGMLVVRGLAREPQHLKATFARLIPLLAGRPAPRVWQT